MDKKLLTPGPLTTSLTTKEAMLHDWGSRDKEFIEWFEIQVFGNLLNMEGGISNEFDELNMAKKS